MTRLSLILRVFSLMLALVFAIGVNAVPHAAQEAAAQTSAGTIAYVRPNNATGDEIHLIEPDGSNDRRIWSTGVAYSPYVEQINGLDWRPDAREIAFASDHEKSCSWYASDVYAIRHDGGGFRRITNAPHCAGLASYPKGSVTVTVQNDNFDTTIYQVYVAGAPGSQSISVAPLSRSTITITDVADFGNGVVQPVVAIIGRYRWMGAAVADVQPGQTVHAGTLIISGSGFEELGAYKPTWHSDGSRIGWILGSCGEMNAVTVTPPAGAIGQALLNGVDELACEMDWGSTTATANQIVYATLSGDDHNTGIFHVTEGSVTRGTRLVPLHSLTANHVHDLHWLPGGSGFLFTMRHVELEILTNIYRYDFGTSPETRLTNFADNEYVGNISISPDGQHVVFERAVEWGAPTDLWIMRVDGSNMRLLVRNARHPAWSPASLPAPLPPQAYLPLIQH